MSTDSVIKEAKRLRDRLISAGNELNRRAEFLRLKANSPTVLVKEAKAMRTEAELAELDGKACLESAKMLQKLGTEVFRLRAGIGCYLDTGDPDRGRLRQMTQNWNDDPRG